MVLRLLIGAALCVAGYFFVRKPELAGELLGRIEFAEKFFSGGSYTFSKLLGVILILFGFLVMTGLYVQVFTAFANLF